MDAAAAGDKTLKYTRQEPRTRRHASTTWLSTWHSKGYYRCVPGPQSRYKSPPECCSAGSQQPMDDGPAIWDILLVLITIVTTVDLAHNSVGACPRLPARVFDQMQKIRYDTAPIVSNFAISLQHASQQLWCI
jgi:hypothetical protein